MCIGYWFNEKSGGHGVLTRMALEYMCLNGTNALAGKKNSDPDGTVDIPTCHTKVWARRKHEHSHHLSSTHSGTLHFEDFSRQVATGQWENLPSESKADAKWEHTIHEV